GFNFSDNLSDGKHKLNFGYKYGMIRNDLEESNISQNNLESGQINSENTTDRQSELLKHRFNGKYDWKVDSMSTITFKLSGSKGNLDVDLRTEVFIRNVVMEPMNSNITTQSSTYDNSNIFFDTYYTLKFK